MKLLAWNLNHRAVRRRIPSWIAKAINEKAPDVLVLTEYVEGKDHDSFLAALKANGLCTVTCPPRRGRENQVLIASRETHHHCELVAPDFHPSVSSNILEVSLASSDVTVLGFRMPAFEGRGRAALKRETWEWLLGEADRLRAGSALIVGDFNTAPGDSRADCGDCLEKLIQNGWQHAPASGYSWRHRPSGTERQIDHIFLSASLVPRRIEYSWEFERLATEGTSGKGGYPDHAMLVCEYNDRHSGRHRASFGRQGFSPK